MLKKLLFVAFVFNFSAGFVWSQLQEIESLRESRKIVRGRLGRKLDDYLKRNVPFGFSGALLVARNDQIILAGGYGLANRERRLPVTTDSVFYIGSLTKQFTAAAVIKLEMQGKLRVTDTLDRIFSDVPEDKKSITIHQLLTHSSGLGDSEEKYGAPIQKEEQLRRVMKAKLLFEPGKRYSYSNAGYSLLAIIVEEVSGQPYETFLRENLFLPAGMLSTGYRLPQREAAKVLRGYAGDLDQGSPLDRPRLADGPTWAIRGAGGMLSTLGDLYRWHLALKKDEILSPQAKQKMFAAHVETDEDSAYGYGWTIQKTPRDTVLIEHNGSDGIFFADFRRYVDEKTVVIGATNDLAGAGLIQSKVPDIVFGKTDVPFPPATNAGAVSPAALQKYTGSYRLPSGALFRVERQRGRLIFDPVGQEALDLITRPLPPDAGDYERMSGVIEKVFAELPRGDFSGLRENTPPERFESLKAFLSEALNSSRQNQRSAARYEVLGTLPFWLVSRQPTATAVRLTGSRGENSLAFITWENGRIRGRAMVEEADDVTLKTPFVARSRKTFAGFHAGLGKVLTVKFKFDRNGTPAALEFPFGRGVKIARRLDENSPIPQAMPTRQSGR